jgi:hypothetical protein
MVNVNTLMTQVMNNPTIFVAGLVVGYLISTIKRKFGGGMGGGLGGGI